jgi:hypothetical protein
MTANQVGSILLIPALVLLACISGCPESAPPPESVLEGTWELIPSNKPDMRLTGCFLTFDSNGELTQVRYTLLDLATVTWNNPPGSVTVEGNQIHVSATQSGNGLTFDGTLDSDTAPTIAPGSLSANLIIGDVQMWVSQGEATLVRQ